MKTNYVGPLLLTLSLMASPAAAATIYVADDFTGAGNGAVMTGRTPYVANVPGGTWQQARSPAGGVNQSGGWYTTTSPGFGNPVPGGFASSANASEAISLGTVPALLNIRADLSVQGTTGPASAGRGVALGFFKAAAVGNGQFSQNGFTGLVLDLSGNLNLVHDPNNTGFFAAGSVLGTPVAYAGGTFNPALLYRLSYDVNTVTGQISNISLQGSTANYSTLTATTLFNATNTAFAGVYQSSGTPGTIFAAMDNFQVSVVPEPAASAMLLTGLLGAALRSRRVR